MLRSNDRQSETAAVGAATGVRACEPLKGTIQETRGEPGAVVYDAQHSSTAASAGTADSTIEPVP